MAPEWTNKIPNYAICNFFYFFFVIYAVLFGLSLINMIKLMIMIDKFNMNNSMILIGVVFTTLISLILTLFHYLICDRSLIDKSIHDVEGFVGAACQCNTDLAKCKSDAKADPTKLKDCADKFDCTKLCPKAAPAAKAAKAPAAKAAKAPAAKKK
jgi:hypothetical protein